MRRKFANSASEYTQNKKKVSEQGHNLGNGGRKALVLCDGRRLLKQYCSG